MQSFQSFKTEILSYLENLPPVLDHNMIIDHEFTYFTVTLLA